MANSFNSMNEPVILSTIRRVTARTNNFWKLKSGIRGIRYACHQNSKESILKNLIIVPGSKKEVLRGPFGNFEVLNGPVL